MMTASACPRCSNPLPDNAKFCPACGAAAGAGPAGGSPVTSEPEFHRWRRNRLRVLVVLCTISIPVGLLFLSDHPETTAIVSGLGLLGLIVALFKLSRIPPLGRGR